MQKAHDASKNTFWWNFPDIRSPITQDELRRMEVSMDVIDDRVVLFDTTKANQTDLLQAVKTITYTKSTGTFRITYFNNTYVDIDTDLEKIAINFDYDDDPTSAHYQQLVIELDDGSYKYIDLSALITQYEFISTSTIQAVVGQDGTISFNIINGSITGDKLEPNYLANCQLAASSATASATAAGNSAEDAEAWAVGQRAGVDVPSTDDTYHNNSKYYCEQARAIVGDKVDSFNGRKGVVVPASGDYNAEQITYGSNSNVKAGLDALNTPTFTQASSRTNIASGDSFTTILGKIKKFFTDLKTVAFTGAYSDLSGKPTIPTVNNGTLTIQQNGSNVATFSANQSGNATANITVPTDTNELTNGAGFITSAGSCAYAIAAQKAVRSDGNGFFVGGCRIRNDNGVPRWNNGIDGTNEKAFVLTPNPHSITLTWNGSAIEVRVDGQYQGTMALN